MAILKGQRNKQSNQGEIVGMSLEGTDVSITSDAIPTVPEQSTIVDAALDPNTLLFRFVAPGQNEIPVRFGEAIHFTTNTPDTIDIKVVEDSAFIHIDGRMVVTQFDINNIRNYTVGEIIFYNGKLYCVIQIPTNSSETPDTDPQTYMPLIPASSRQCFNINFSNGMINWNDSSTWPTIISVQNIIASFQPMREVFTINGLTSALGIPAAAFLENSLIAINLELMLAPLKAAMDDALNSIFAVDGVLAPLLTSGLISTDVYIGQANVGLLPALSPASTPQLDKKTGAPYPTTVPSDGRITSFTAAYENFAAIDLNWLGLEKAFHRKISSIAALFIKNIQVLVPIVNLISGMLSSDMAANLPDNIEAALMAKLDPDMVNNPSRTKDHLYAVLWHGTPSNFEGEIIWQKVSQLDLGKVAFTGETLTDKLNQILTNRTLPTAGSTHEITGYLGARETEITLPIPNPVYTQTGQLAEPFPVKAGDYLMIQYKMEGDGTTVLSGLFASALMASVAIEQ